MACGMSSEDSTIEKGLIQVIQTLYDHVTSAVLLNNQLGEFFQMTIGIRQGYTLPQHFSTCFWRESCKKPFTTTPLLSPLVADLSVTYALQMILTSWQAVTVSCRELTNKLVATAGAYGIEISTVKSKVMVNSTNNASVSIIMDSEKLEEVSSFKYLGATLTKDGTCKTEICIGIAAATAGMARLTRVWKSNISFQTKFKLYKSLVVSILPMGVRPGHSSLRQKDTGIWE